MDRRCSFLVFVLDLNTENYLFDNVFMLPIGIFCSDFFHILVSINDNYLEMI